MECFVTFSNAIEQRLDCHFYQPKFVELENRISKLTDKKLGDYIIAIAGGATPNKNEAGRYYTKAENGVPFLRVQNVSPEGLNLENLVFINQETHDNMLKRSQVKENYLITKITGVGRMAVSSVVPPGFEGNINQHLVAMKTESPEVSRVLAAFLNSDIGERLASRRSTGGTRPALDYEALKTIPIVFEPRIVDIIQAAYKLKRQKEAKAQSLLDSIDEYVLGELGISYPELSNQMCYAVKSEQVVHNRMDSYYHQPKFHSLLASLKESGQRIKSLGELSSLIINGADYRKYISEGVPYLRVSNIRPNQFDLRDIKFIPDLHLTKDISLNPGDLLVTRKGTYGVAVVASDECKDMVISSEIFRVVLHREINPHFLSLWLNNGFTKLMIDRVKTGGIMGHLSQEVLRHISIPIPVIETQNRIVEEAFQRIVKAKTLQQESNTEVEKAKAEVEHLILRK